MSNNRTEIIELLRSTNRPGIDNVIAWLDTEPSFYEASGARIHHDNVKGGLAYPETLHSRQNILWRV